MFYQTDASISAQWKLNTKDNLSIMHEISRSYSTYTVAPTYRLKKDNPLKHLQKELQKLIHTQIW